MTNTISATLLIDTLANTAKTTLGARLAPLASFTKDFSQAVYTQTKSVVVPVVTGGSSTLTNPTGFEAGDSTESVVSVTMNHYSQPFHITSAQLNEQIRLEDLAAKNLQVLAEKIMDVAMTPVDATNFTNGSGIIAQASLAVGDLQTGWASIAKSGTKNLLLDGVAFSKFLPTSLTSFGFQNGAPALGFDAVYLHTRWNGAVAGTYGFICGPDAIAQASGIPDIHPAVKSLMLESQIVKIDSLGLSVQINIWGSASSRAVWASYDLFYGAAYGADGAASGYRLKSA